MHELEGGEGTCAKILCPLKNLTNNRISCMHSWGATKFHDDCCYLCFTTVTEEAEPCQRGETEGGDPRERSPLLCLRVHEGEPLPADEGQVRGETGTRTGNKH